MRLRPKRESHLQWARRVRRSARSHVQAFRGRGGDDIVVSGPDYVGQFTIGTTHLGAGTRFVYVERFVLEDIIDELQRRLKERA